MDDLAHGKIIKNYTTICTRSMIGLDVYKTKMELADWWGTDPVHMPPAGYGKIAESLAEKADRLTPPKAETSRPPSAAQPRRTDTELLLTARRIEGISRSDTTASRWGRDESGMSSFKGDKTRGHGDHHHRDGRDSKRKP